MNDENRPPEYCISCGGKQVSYVESIWYGERYTEVHECQECKSSIGLQPVMDDRGLVTNEVESTFVFP